MNLGLFPNLGELKLLFFTVCYCCKSLNTSLELHCTTNDGYLRCEFTIFESTTVLEYALIGLLLSLNSITNARGSYVTNARGSYVNISSVVKKTF